MNTTYLSNEKIKQIAEMCENCFTPRIKSRFNELSTKFKVKFTASKQMNLNLLWMYCIDELSKDANFRINTGQTFKEAIEINRKTGNATLMIRDYVNVYLDKNHKDEHIFLTEFDAEYLIFSINLVLQSQGLNVEFTANELLEVSNYEKYFKQLYGIENVNKTSLQASEKIGKFINELTTGIKHPELLMQAITAYLINKDISELNNSLNK
jgi:hypothetical protein